MSCDLDPINMCCWTHGVEIDEADYMEGVCELGYAEDEMEPDDDEDDDL